MKTFLLIVAIFFLIITIIKTFNYLKQIMFKGFKQTKGKIVRNVNVNTEEFIKQERDMLERNHPKVTNIMKTVFEITEDDNINKGNEPSYKAAIQYIVSGKKYEAFTNISKSAKWKKGKSIKITYNPKNPNEVLVKDGNIVIFLILGIVMLLIWFLI